MHPFDRLEQLLQQHAMWGEQITLARHDFLITPGRLDTRLYLVEKGTLRIYIDDGEQEQTIRFGYRDNLIAALDSFVTEQPTEYYLQALKKTVLRPVSKEQLMTFVKSDPELLLLWVRILEQFVYQQMERERDILTRSPVERYQRVLQRSPRLFQEIPLKYIAAYLRMTPETLSRIRNS